MAGTLTISTLSDGTNSTSATNAIQGSAKAWVNFNGTTSPGTIRAAYNVGSVTKNSTGDYTVNFTNSFADANYSFAGMCKPTTAQSNQSIGRTVSGHNSASPTSGSMRIVTTSTGVGLEDYDIVCVSFFR